jgi:hypothetical protein
LLPRGFSIGAFNQRLKNFLLEKFFLRRSASVKITLARNLFTTRSRDKNQIVLKARKNGAFKRANFFKLKWVKIKTAQEAR